MRRSGDATGDGRRARAVTAQISDTVLHVPHGAVQREGGEEKQFMLARWAGDGLFDPKALGVEPVMISTACYRGYLCEYAVRDGRLVLHALSLGLDERDQKRLDAGELRVFGKSPERVYRTVQRWEPFGREPGPPERVAMMEWRAEGLGAPVGFTGGLLLGADFVRELYVHMGSHPAWKYREVRELTFEKGALVADNDRSALMEELRSEVRAHEARSFWTRLFTKGPDRRVLEKALRHSYGG